MRPARARSLQAQEVGGGDVTLGGVDGCWGPGASRIRPEPGHQGQQSVHPPPTLLPPPSLCRACPLPRAVAHFQGEAPGLGATAPTLPGTGQEGAASAGPEHLMFPATGRPLRVGARRG